MKRILVFLRYGYELFSKHLFTNLLLIAELLTSIVAINLTVSTVQGLYTDVNIIKSMDESTIFVMPSSDLNADSPNESLSFTQIKGVFEVGESTSSYLVTPFKNNGIILYNEAILTHTQIPLSKGGWDSPVIEIDEKLYYPVIINNEDALKYGNTFTADTGIQTISCYVAGVLDSKERYLKLSSVSNVASTSQTVGKCDGELKFFCNTAHLSEDLFDYKTKQSNKILFFKEASIDDAEYNLNLLRNQAFVFTRNDIVFNSMQIIKENVKYYVPLGMGILFVSIVGIIAFSLLSIYKNINFYKSAFLCGARSRDCIFIAFASYFWLIILSLAMLAIIFSLALLFGMIEQLDLILSHWNAIITLFIYFTVLLSGGLAPLVLIRKFKKRAFSNSTKEEVSK